MHKFVDPGKTSRESAPMEEGRAIVVPFVNQRIQPSWSPSTTLDVRGLGNEVPKMAVAETLADDEHVADLEVHLQLVEQDLTERRVFGIVFLREDEASGPTVDYVLGQTSMQLE
jgi:hypothetical protein